MLRHSFFHQMILLLTGLLQAISARGIEPNYLLAMSGNRCSQSLLPQAPRFPELSNLPDLQQFAVRTNASGQAEAYFNLSQDDFEKILARQDSSYFIARLKSGYREPWTSSLYPNEMIRRIAFDYHPLLNQLGLTSFQSRMDYFESQIPNTDILQAAPTIKNEIEKLETAPQLNQAEIESAKSIAISGSLCGQYTLIHVEKCIVALRDILNRMSPREYKSVYDDSNSIFLSLFPMYGEIFTQPIYHEALRLGARQMLEWIEYERKPDLDLLRWLTSLFEKLGSPSDLATDQAWKIIALYSTRGPNLGETLKMILPKSLEKTAAAAAIVFNGMMVLDSRSFKSGSPFSYPIEVTTQIDSGKPYHFWLSAYLARELTRQTGSPIAAVYATWITQLGYQMRSTTDGRDPSRAFRLKSMSDANNKIRLDLAIASAGAVYGAFQPTQMNINEALMELLKNAGHLQPLSEKDAQAQWRDWKGTMGFYRWNQLFAPDVALDFHLKSLRQKTDSSASPRQ